jgi:beta-lactamase regulating signal transducer with metallopeptidase domain
MDILNTLFEISVYSIILFGAIMAVKKIMGKKMSPRLHYLVWFILIARLLMPFTPDSGLRLIHIPAYAAVQTQQGSASAPTVQTVNDAGETAALTTQAASNAAIDAPVQDLQRQNSAPTAKSQTTEAPKTSAAKLQTILLSVWLMGVGGYIVYLLLSWMLMRIKVQKEGFEPTTHLTALLEACKRSLGVRGNIKIVGTCGLATPALFGPQTILMPMEIILARDDERILFALRHELMHYKRWDHAVSVLISLMQAVYWFNPIFWLAARQMRTDMEVACDNAVAQKLSGSEKNSYAHLIVSMSAGKPQGQRMLGMASGNARRTAEKRVRGIYAAGKSRAGVKAAVLSITAVLIVSCFTTACQPVQVAATGQGTGTPVQAAKPSASIAAETEPESSAGIASDSPRLQYDAPENWQETLKKDNSVIQINTAVTLPEVSSYPEYKATKGTFSQDQINKWISYFVGDKKLLEAPVMTKADYQERIDVMDGSTDKTRRQQLQDQMRDAPDKSPKKYATDTTLDTNTDKRSYYWVELKDGGYGTVGFSNISFFYCNGMMALPESQLAFSKTNDGQALSVKGTYKITPEEAEEAALKTLSQLGITGYAPESYEKAYLYGYEEYSQNLSNLDWQGKTPVSKGYYIRLAQNMGGIQEAFVGGGTRSTYENYAYEPPNWIGDMFYVYIDEDGNMQSMKFTQPVQLTGKVTDNAELMPFSDMQEKIRTELLSQASNLPSPLGINRMELKMMALKDTDDHNGAIYVPAWFVYTDYSDPATLTYGPFIFNATDGGRIAHSQWAQ